MAEVCLVSVHEKSCTSPRVLQRHTSPGMPEVLPVPGFISSCIWQELPQPSSMAECGPVPGCGSSRSFLQVRDVTAFPIHFFLIPDIKITSHLPYCDLVLAYKDNTNRN